MLEFASRNAEFGGGGNDLTIVSGGQTGVDRGALDAALARGIPCGGWCPADRRAEDGIIPVRYPLLPLPGGGYRERTRQNVQDSDGTLILYFGVLEGGTEETLRNCLDHAKPYHLIDGDTVAAAQAAALAARFIARAGIRVLNVAGPRASKQPRAYHYAFSVIRQLTPIATIPEVLQPTPSGSARLSDRRPAIYLAGPEVFRPDVREWGARLRDCCTRYGFRALLPGEAEADLPAATFATAEPRARAEALYRANLALLWQADAVVADLNPFRGAEPDSGTAFELGYAVARSLPVYGYLHHVETLRERIARHYGPLNWRDGAWWDRDGCRVEGFDLPLNLMLAVPVRLVVGDAEACLKRLCEDWATGEAVDRFGPSFAPRKLHGGDAT